MRQSKFSRRTFLQNSLNTASIFVAVVLGGGCNNNNSVGDEKKQASGTNACNDLSGIDRGELEKREKLAYVDKSPVSESYCGNCSMYVPGAEGKDCGTCLLFKGPVYASGYCIQYVAKA